MFQNHFKRRPNDQMWSGNEGGVTVRVRGRRARAKFLLLASYVRDLRCGDIESGRGVARLRISLPAVVGVTGESDIWEPL